MTSKAELRHSASALVAISLGRPLARLWQTAQIDDVDRRSASPWLPGLHGEEASAAYDRAVMSWWRDGERNITGVLPVRYPNDAVTELEFNCHGEYASLYHSVVRELGL